MKKLTYWELTLADVKGFRELLVEAHAQGINYDYELRIVSPRNGFGWGAFWTDYIGEQHRLEILRLDSGREYIHSLKDGSRWIDVENGTEVPSIPECIMDAVDLAIERYSKNYGE